MTFTELANFIWSVADDLRGDYKQADYGKIILPFALLRRLDCVLEPTKAAVLAEYTKRKDQAADLDVFLKRKSKQSFYNTSEFTFASLLDDQKHIRQNLVKYIGDFSEDARDVFERFKFIDRVTELDDKNLLFILVKKFAAIDMHPDVIPNEVMGLAFEELIRKFAEASNETAGEHFTPREVIRLMVMLLFAGDDAALSKPGAVRSLYDPTAGTGGMLSVGEHVIAGLNPSARLRLYGQELNDESYAICKADMLIKGQDPNNIHRGNTLAEDKLAGLEFDYALSNPPFGVDWKKVHDVVKAEHEKKKFAGRFGPGLPRVSDGSMLFLLHLISKMRHETEGGSRIGIVLNGSPLFTGGAGSGESEIRRYLLEHDLVEAIVGGHRGALPYPRYAKNRWQGQSHGCHQRPAAVRYKLAMDRYLKDLADNDPAYAQMGTLVAYSGNVKDAESGPDEFTESSMNAIHGREPAEAFEEDDYRLLLVANKYQTGFDQPLLHTMYVDKKLSGVLAVQTLSRLNRVCSGKNETFVLDFVNKPEDILASFKPYYRTAELEDVTDPNLVHELHIKLDQAKVYHWNEVEAFANAFFDPKRKQSALHGHLKPAYDRWKDLDAGEAEQFRKNLGTFIRMYDFLSQIIPYDDLELEQLYAFGKHLMPRLVEHGGGGLPDLTADVKLTHYRLQKLGEQRLDLETGDVVKLHPSTGAGPKAKPSEAEVELREIVEKMNDLFSGSLTEADLVGYLATMKGKLLANDRLADQAASNTEEQFALGDFPDILTDIVIEGQEAHNTIADQLLQDKRIFGAMQGILARMVYRAFQNKGST